MGTAWKRSPWTDPRSFDPDGTIVSYQWTEGGRVLGNTAVLTTNFSVGRHEVKLTVTDCALKTHSDTVIINVLPPPPTPVQVRVGQPYLEDFSWGMPGSPQGWEFYLHQRRSDLGGRWPAADG